MDQLKDELEIIDLLNRYGVAIDARDWAMFRTVFTDDVVVDYGVHGHWDDLDRWAYVFERIHRHFAATQHSITNHQVELDGDRARARSYVNALLVVPDQPGGSDVTVRGYYDDELVRTPSGWRIARRTLHPIWYQGNLGIAGFQPGEKPPIEPPWSVS